MRLRTSDSLRRKLESDIEEGRLAPGDSIDEQALAERFAVSRTPAREALLQLAAAGLIRFVPRHGAVVNEISAQKAIALIEVLAALEAQAAQLSARRMADGERRKLRSLHKAARAAVTAANVRDYIERNAALHAAIYAGARNEYLTETIRAARVRLNVTSRAGLHQPGRLLESWREHGCVVDAICKGDGEAAAAAMTTHITRGGQVFADMVATLPEQSERRAKAATQ